MTKKIEIIDNTKTEECRNCMGTGFSVGKAVRRKQAIKKACVTCKGTGIWKEGHFYLVDNVNKIAFDIDSPGK